MGVLFGASLSYQLMNAKAENSAFAVVLLTTLEVFSNSSQCAKHPVFAQHPRLEGAKPSVCFRIYLLRNVFNFWQTGCSAASHKQEFPEAVRLLE